MAAMKYRVIPVVIDPSTSKVNKVASEAEGRGGEGSAKDTAECNGAS